MPWFGKTPRIEFIVLKDRNIPLEQDLQLTGHAAPIGRYAYHQTRASFQQLSHSMAVVLRKNALFVRPAFEAPDARPYGKLAHIDPLHFGACRARFIGNDLEKRRRHSGLPGAAVEKEYHTLHLLYGSPLTPPPCTSRR